MRRDVTITVSTEGLELRAREAWDRHQREAEAAEAVREQEYREGRMGQLAARILRCLNVDGVRPLWEEELGAVAVVDGLVITQDKHWLLRLVKERPRCGGWITSHSFNGLADLGRVLEMAEETRFPHRCPEDEATNLVAPPPPPEPTVAERLLQALDAYIAAAIDERVPV